MSKNNIKYNEKQLIESGLIYFNDDKLATDVWIKKYALKNDDKWEELHPSQTISRITDEIIRMENMFPNPLPNDIISKYLEDFKYFIPAGSILFGLGNPYQISSLGNCFFIHNDVDSYGGIFNTDESMVQLMKRRGGVGVTIEHLRPSNAKVNNAAQSSTGAVSFMDRFSHSTREVAQDGRRGALMITCFSPDTMVYTNTGWEYITKTIERWHNNENPLAWTHEGFREIEDVQEFPETEIFEVMCENFKTIKVTHEHKFVVRNMETHEEYLKELQHIDVTLEEPVFWDIDKMIKNHSRILNITFVGKSKVYDFTVKDTHRILANNFYTSNCHIDHPDIKQFIAKKDDLTKVTGANISVKVTDEFMNCYLEPSDKIYITLNNGEKIMVDANEEIEIDGKIMLAKDISKIV